MKLLKHWLKSSKTTQVAFGELEGVKQATVSDWVVGNSAPTHEKLLSISKRTGIPISKLVADCAEDERERRESSAA